MANNNGSKGGATGLGLAALAAAAAGAYYFYGSSKSAGHRKNLKSWAVKAKGEVMERMEQMQDITQGTYEKAVSEVMDKYKKVKSIDPKELAAAAMEMKNQWNKIASHLKPVTAPKRKTAAKRK